jgi:hypothetical protein
VFVLRIPFSLDVPVLEYSNDVTWIGLAELKFHFVSVIALGIFVLKEKIQSSGPWMHAFAISNNNIAQSEDSRIFLDSVLDPSFVVVRVIGEVQPFNFHVRQRHRVSFRLAVDQRNCRD